MGHSRIRPLSASRFTEGSMNDRTSNAPPVHFLDAAERARLEKPLRPMSDDWADKQVKKNRLLGHMWDGVRGRLRFRRDADEQRGKARKGKDEERVVVKEDGLEGYQQLVADGFFAPGVPVSKGPMASVTAIPLSTTPAATITPKPTPKPSIAQLRPTKEEVMENYHHLVASGFFSSHAIQSTRHAAPPTTHTTAPSTSSSNTNTKATNSARTSQDHLRPPQLNWPLSRSATPSTSRAPSPVRSPTSASSRGTKRAAIDHASDDEADKENDPPTPKKKPRKMASQKSISIPKLRNVASKRNILTRRIVSGPQNPGKEGHKLAKRMLNKLPGNGGRNSFEVPAARRCASGQGVEDRKDRLQDFNVRVLRTRKSANEGLCVAPDSNLGIPKVPAIPAKFTIGENRENTGPWRGLRR